MGLWFQNLLRYLDASDLCIKWHSVCIGPMCNLLYTLNSLYTVLMMANGMPMLDKELCTAVVRESMTRKEIWPYSTQMQFFF